MRLALALVAVCLATSHVRAAGPAKPEVARPNGEWLHAYLGAASRLPFSFTYGRLTSGALLGVWQEKTESKALDGGRTEQVTRWTDPKTRLQIVMNAVTYPDSSVLEWTVSFKNEGDTDTPIIEDIQALDVSFPVLGHSIPTLLYSRGAGGMDTYALQKTGLDLLQEFRMSNEGGGKTGETIPFFDIRMEGGGLIGAVGWAGKWAISFSRPSGAAVEVRAGMKKTHLALHPKGVYPNVPFGAFSCG